MNLVLAISFIVAQRAVLVRHPDAAVHAYHEPAPALDVVRADTLDLGATAANVAQGPSRAAT